MATATLIIAALPATPPWSGSYRTGWYPTAVAMAPDGGRIWVVNGKSNTGPVPANCRPTS